LQHIFSKKFVNWTTFAGDAWVPW